MKPRIYVTRLIAGEAMRFLEESFEVSSWAHEEKPVPHDILIACARGTHGILSTLSDSIDRAVLDAASPGLRVVANMAVGSDNIDVDGCTRRGIIVTNVGDASTDTVADLVFGLILAVARRIPEAQNALLRGLWRGWSPDFMAGREVHGRTLGVVGFGRIGQAVAKRSQGFSMRVLYWDKLRRQEIERETGVEYADLPRLMSNADLIAVVLPLNEATRGIIGEREISLMKPTAMLVNAGRGPTVDSRALYNALVQGKIFAAGLDVFDVEPVSPFDPLVSLKNVVALPHIGSATLEARIGMAMSAAENLAAVLSGQQPKNLVNPEVLDVLEKQPWLQMGLLPVIHAARHGFETVTH